MLYPTTKNKKTREDKGNYRPVSLASVPGKVMEIVLGDTEKHLKNEVTIRHRNRGSSLHLPQRRFQQSGVQSLKQVIRQEEMASSCAKGVVRHWNWLPREVLQSSSLEVFKR